jgi:hypothetical protein
VGASVLCECDLLAARSVLSQGAVQSLTLDDVEFNVTSTALAVTCATFDVDVLLNVSNTAITLLNDDPVPAISLVTCSIMR